MPEQVTLKFLVVLVQINLDYTGGDNNSNLHFTVEPHAMVRIVTGDIIIVALLPYLTGK
jgi:hypothetical protein